MNWIRRRSGPPRFSSWFQGRATQAIETDKRVYPEALPKRRRTPRLKKSARQPEVMWLLLACKAGGLRHLTPATVLPSESDRPIAGQIVPILVRQCMRNPTTRKILDKMEKYLRLRVSSL